MEQILIGSKARRRYNEVMSKGKAKIALVHDFLNEFGGAERVLVTLSEMCPEAPIYTAFCINDSDAGRALRGRKIVESRWAPLIKRWRLYSPLRFLLPVIWGSMDLTDYDTIITSCSGYIARGFKVKKGAKVIAYCHTPPRFLYGYRTSVDWQKHALVRLYAYVVNHFLRIFDYESAQRVDVWVVNSENVKQRVWKHYRKEAVVVYPPVEVEKIIKATRGTKKDDYYLIVSRLVGAKGLEEAAKAAAELGFKLKIAGGTAGYARIKEELLRIGGEKVELLGRVGEKELYELYGKAKGFIALARDEDFGMTVVEAQAAGTPVVAFNGGGFKESVIDGETGVLIEETTAEGIKEAIERIEKGKWDKDKLITNARRFSKEAFLSKMEKIMRESVHA